MLRRKITSAIIGLALMAGVAKAQETETIYSSKKEPRPMNTIIKSDKGFGGHLSLNAKGTEIYDEAAVLVGGELVFTLSHALNIGMAGYGMPSRIEWENPNDILFDEYYLEMGYGGFFIEPVFFDQQVVHFTVPILIGAGWAGLSDQRYFEDTAYPVRILDETAFFVFEPGINAEINLARNVKFTLGGTYRMVSGTDLRDVSDSDLGGFSISGGVRIGWF